AQADPPARARASRCGRARSARAHPDRVFRGRARGCRCGGGGDQPCGVPRSAHARGDRGARARGLPRGRPLELLGCGAGVRVQLGDRRAGRKRMSRVLVTGGVGMIGAAVVRRLLSDPEFEVRVSDQRPAPHWIREGCEVHTSDLRLPAEALAATKGCTHVIHLAGVVGGIANFHRLPHTLTEVNNALYNAVVRAALECDVERYVYVSSSMVFERAELFPTPEDYLPQCPVPLSAYAS